MEKKEFKSESKRLLDLMINSIYTNKDIFLRELVSNASDALDKLYYKSLTNKDLNINKEDLEINIAYDKDAREITISDNGIGMTKDELEDNLGTIAKSGSLSFKETMSEEEKKNIIGQFGVGFYSAFMVSDKIEVESKSIDSEVGYSWESEGVDGYTIKKNNIKDNGTTIKLHLKNDDDEFEYSKYLDEYEIKDLIKKYSDYVSFPIKMEVVHEHLKEDSKKKKDKDAKPEYEKVKEIEVLNSMIPIWKKNKNDVKEEDYNNFYMNKFSDYDKPLKVITSSVEGITSYKALLFIPSHAPYDFYSKEYEKGLSIYCNGVMIMEKCANLLPDYFSFVKGVVDTEDLPLNISRESLQESKNLKLIAKNIETKIKNELKDMLDNDRDTYISFFKSFGTQLKYGVYNNYGMDKEKVQDLIMFYSNNEDKLITLKEYVDSMKEKQEKIYYATGESLEKVRNMPQVELVKEKEYDILLLTDYVDEFAISALREYEGKSFVNIEKDELDLESEEEKEKIKESNDKNKDLLSKMKDIISDVSEVKFTNRLKTYPVCLTTKGEVSIEMQKVFDSMPNSMGMKADKILEINDKHPISKKLKKLYKESEKDFEKYTKILYSQAKLIAGLPVDDATEISNLICDELSK